MLACGYNDSINATASPRNVTEQLRPQIRVCMAAVVESLKKENPEYEQS